MVSPHLQIRLIALGLVITLVMGCGGNTVTPPGGGGGGGGQTINLNSVSLNSGSVQGGTSVQGTVSLTGTPSTAVTVSLSSSAGAATVPGSISISGSSANFTVSTTTVTTTTTAVITASFNGQTRTANLDVTPAPAPAPTLTANFTVRSLSPAIRAGGTVLFPAGTADVCPLVTTNGNPMLDCQLDGSASTSAPSTSIQRFLWRYLFGPFDRNEESAGPQYRPAESGCGFFGGRSASSSGGVQFLQIVFELRVRDNTGAVSGIRQNPNVRVFPNGLCGYGF